MKAEEIQANQIIKSPHKSDLRNSIDTSASIEKTKIKMIKLRIQFLMSR